MQKLGRYRVILDREDQDPYLERYYLFLRDRKTFPFNIFLHKFLKGDPYDLHDHPWPYATLILRGGYYEWIPEFDRQGKLSREIKKWRGPGHFRFCKASEYHRIELKPGVTPWTLFMPGPHQREWGFLKDGDTWVPHQNYVVTKEKIVQAQNT